MQSISGSSGSWSGGSGEHEPGRQSPAPGGGFDGGAWMGQHMEHHPITLEQEEGVVSLGRMVVRHKLKLAFGLWRRQFREAIGKLRMRRIMSKKKLGAPPSSSASADNPDWENVDKADVDMRTRRLWNSFDQVVGLGAGVSARKRRCSRWRRHSPLHGHRYMLHPFGNQRGSWDILILLLMIWVGLGRQAWGSRRGRRPSTRHRRRRSVHRRRRLDSSPPLTPPPRSPPGDGQRAAADWV